ncbi:uncharacterized protein H6S33_002725 [Morchella sextelata]|uniref:uncharacterized protein n=1 Tax=Morchella sextelata TaxID=1174677 RepID=UPI001D057CE4|nr:uncharacterized protein H6S33_002725 [Morchella sextelata]KAH0607691.1 hypothetical protein H6S33_002725 [Morchella sextelata]
MSAMMAAGTSGPTPVTQFASVPSAPQQRGHSRQPSSTARSPGQPPQQHQQQQQQYQQPQQQPAQSQGGESSTRREGGGRARSNSQAPPQNGAGGSSSAQQEAYARVASQQPKMPAGSANQRVHAPRPPPIATSATGGAPGPGASASSRTRQAEPSRQPEQARAQAQSGAQAQPQSQRHAQSQQQGQQAGSSSRPATSAAPGLATAPGAPSSSTSRQPGQTVTSSFPHAFERWERLSSRWEGLTGYWISRLEHNREELKNLPLEQEMARQISDLSTAGANLFQAVVELQRLRASSERKFQRWFFDTKSDQERAKEMSSELERSLRVERQKRADAVTNIQKLEKEKATAEKLVEEMRRELQISREECRRAWEELGRREQEERERTNSLREGHPTLVGGVQVLPMPMPGMPMPTRSGSGARPRTSSSSHAGGSAQPDAQPYQEHYDYYGSSPVQSDLGRSDLGRSDLGRSDVGRSDVSAGLHHEPASPAHAQHTSTAAATAPSSGVADQLNIHPDPTRTFSPESGSYVTNGSGVRSRHSGSVTISDTSDVGFNDTSGAWELDAQGQVLLDETGNPVRQYERREPSRAELEDEDEEELSWNRMPNYDGAAYSDNGGGGVPVGYGPGWETIPRAPHHHPTRLSDVPEEEEERRTLMGSEGGRMSR